MTTVEVSASVSASAMSTTHRSQIVTTTLETNRQDAPGSETAVTSICSATIKVSPPTIDSDANSDPTSSNWTLEALATARLVISINAEFSFAAAALTHLRALESHGTLVRRVTYYAALSRIPVAIIAGLDHAYKVWNRRQYISLQLESLSEPPVAAGKPPIHVKAATSTTPAASLPASCSDIYSAKGHLTTSGRDAVEESTFPTTLDGRSTSTNTNSAIPPVQGPPRSLTLSISRHGRRRTTLAIPT